MSTGLDLTPLLKHVPPDDLAGADELLDGPGLARHLLTEGAGPYSLLAVGDIMLGGRARRPMLEHGVDYPFRGVQPLLDRSAIVLGNLEGPLAARARKKERNFSYRVRPETAAVMAQVGVNVVTLANNHLVDCGRSGVLETLAAVKAAGVAVIGAGRNEREAHAPVVRDAHGLRVGLLGYYWNRRTAATADLPGSAMDPPEALEADITALRATTDRIVVTFHWGIPYEREPLPEDRVKARLAIELGADVVVGHHPHVAQPFEIHWGRPIFYSVGNFTFGSGNSRGEGLALGVRFEAARTIVDVFPLYVKNRDPRIDYQPKVLRGGSGRRVLERLARASGAHGVALQVGEARGVLTLPRQAGVLS
jgi:poly-gamma-glutamate capsule biosynthesis protein CapA/YwtB (metallophosphatase superfamily)